MSAVVILWSVWCGCSLLRAMWSLLALRRFRRRAEPLPAERERALRLWPAQRDSGRAPTLRVSRDVATAGAFGFHPPIIALSPTTLAALSNADLDRVVAHEHAHVQRRDDVGRVLLVAIQAVFGLHPAVWWIGRAIDLEREIACDDWVLALTGDGPRYARCLTTLAGVSPPPRWSLAPGVSLATRRLTMRVTRLLDQASAAAPGFHRGRRRVEPGAPVDGGVAGGSEAGRGAGGRGAGRFGDIRDRAGVTSISAPLPTPATLARRPVPAPPGLEQAASGRCRCTAARPSRPDDRCAAADFGVSRVGACDGASSPALTNLRTAASVAPLGTMASGVAGVSSASPGARACRGQESGGPTPGRSPPMPVSPSVPGRASRLSRRPCSFPLWKVRRVVVPTDASEPEAEEVGLGYSSATSSVVSSKS